MLKVSVSLYASTTKSESSRIGDSKTKLVEDTYELQANIEPFDDIPDTSFFSFTRDGLTYAYGVLQMNREYCRNTQTTTWYKFRTNIKHCTSGPVVTYHKTGYEEWWIDGELVDCTEWQMLTKFILDFKRKFNIGNI